ncbi:MAG TPA: DUF3106 domain-containing protein [Candidatus Acidoferrales bacterium]|nr:DUF3106 domain-containing protein [Candidatus Acidoferrales bacterium]
MRKLLQFGFGLAAIFLTASLAQSAIAQRGFGMQRAQQRQRARRPFPPPPKPEKNVKPQGKPNPRGMMGLPPKWVENLRNISPEEQERFMNNDARFRSLPPERQDQIRRNLARWNQLTPQQRDAMRRNERILERLTPEEREEVRTDLFPRWQKLPQERRELIQGRLRVLGGMTPEARQQKLQDPEFMQGLDANEQDLLRKLSDLRLGPGANPGQ